MKILLRYTFMLFLLCSGVIANAQAPSTKLELSDMTKVSDSPMRWKYGTVTCISTNRITSITLSMINNQLFGSNTSGITPSQTLNSLGHNPRTITYLFNSGITAAQVESFLEGITFEQTSEISGTNPWVDITVDANPTRLPTGATITVWREHPDGSSHYYVWVNTNSYIGYMQAYNSAKSYYFQGMRGYLPTITSVTENSLLTNISNLGGWSGGSRTTSTSIADQKSISIQPVSSGANFRWLCGPETNFDYYRGPTWNTSGAGPIAGSYSGWPPSGGQPDAASGGANGGENVMQINYNGYWNDLPAPQNTHDTSVLTGYFIEFGGNGKAYNVGAAVYSANDKYNEAKVSPNGEVVSNDQWEGFSSGNRASTSTTFKPNVMRANVLVIE